jgi:hypothetical protein
VNLKEQYWGTYDEMQSYLEMEKAKERFFSVLQKKGLLPLLQKIMEAEMDLYTQTSSTLTKRMAILLFPK